MTNPENIFTLLESSKNEVLFKSIFRTEAEQYVNFIWKTAHPYIGDRRSHFINLGKDNFEGACWQLYLIHCLKVLGLDVKGSSEKGPDILFVHAGKKHWIECVCPCPGDDDDQNKVRKTPSGRPMETEIILKLRGALEGKFNGSGGSYLNRLREGIVQEDETYIVAISAGRLPDAGWCEPGLTFMDKAVFGLGKPGWVVPLGGQASKTAIFQKDSVEKRRTEQESIQISTMPFLNKSYCGISGVLYTPLDLLNFMGRDGRDLLFIHNPNATVRCTRGLFKTGCERWHHEGCLHLHKWNRDK